MKSRIPTALSALLLGLSLALPTHGALIAHYQFESGDTNAKDSVGSNDGTFNNGAGLQTSDLPPVPGGTTAALELDGADDHVIVSAGILEGLSEFSVAFWARKDLLEDQPGGDPSESRFVASDGSNVFHIRESDGQLGGKGPGDHLEFRMADSNGDWIGVNSDNEVTVMGVWQHVAMTYNGTDLVGYVDGEEVARLNTPGITTNDPGEPTLFGANSDGSAAQDSYLDGGLDDVRFYDNALTQSEVQALVPEPASAALLALGGLAMLRRRRTV